MLEKILRKPKISGCYKVRQSINNFKIRIKIMQQKSILADLFEHDTDVSDTNFLDKEERIFRWQEKVLGPVEIKFYSDDKNCATPSQKEYHQDIVEGNVEIVRLHSYIDEDACFPEKDIFVKTKTLVTTLATRNQEALPLHRNRKPFTNRYNKMVLEELPKKDRIKTNHYLYKEQEVMHIVVDLSSKNEESSIANEALLCTIIYDKIGKNLIVNPDFTSEDEPYGVDSSEMSYDYWIWHASEGQTKDDLHKELTFMQREMQILQLLKKMEKYKELKVPPAGVFRLFVNMDIISAKNFNYDYVFVSYFVSLPKNWNVQREDTLYGRTQRCKIKNGKVHFSYVSEMTLDFHWRKDDGMSSPTWPQLFISVASLDSWTRYRIEGYGSLFLPSDPGIHEIEVHTWRPAGNFQNTLRRFFTGGTYELEDITYCGVPQDHEDIILQKSNLKIIASGSVKLKFNVIQQGTKDDEYLQTEVVRNQGNRGSNPEEVLAQFKAARERMMLTKSIRSNQD